MSLNTGDSPNAVQLYLVPWIQTAKLKSGMPKVNIIAHSMGGLLSRSYIQSDLYKDDVDKLAMVGTPNHGAAVAYYVSEGGDTKGADETGGLFFRLLPAFYTKTMGELYRGWYGIKPFGPRLVQQRLVYSFTRDHIPSLRQITPTFSFLSPGW